jgi:putative tRNA adenosine deaminase-associated protein
VAANESYAVVVFRELAGWQVGILPEVLTEDLDGLIAAVRQQSGQGGSFALVDVADEFFVVVRVRQGSVRLLLSDVTAAVAWDLAAQVLDALGLEMPGQDDLEDVWPVGDLGVFDVWASMRWSWVPSCPTSTRTPTRCSRPWPADSVSPTPTSG